MATWTYMEGNADYAYADVTIASGASLTDAIDLIDYELVRIDMPTAWTAASLTFQVSADGDTYTNLYKSGSEFEKSEAAASVGVGIEPVDSMLMHRYLKVRSGTSSTAMNQAAERTLRLVARKV